MSDDTNISIAANDAAESEDIDMGHNLDEDLAEEDLTSSNEQVDTVNNGDSLDGQGAVNRPETDRHGDVARDLPLRSNHDNLCGESESNCLPEDELGVLAGSSNSSGQSQSDSEADISQHLPEDESGCLAVMDLPEDEMVANNDAQMDEDRLGEGARPDESDVIIECTESEMDLTQGGVNLENPATRADSDFAECEQNSRSNGSVCEGGAHVTAVETSEATDTLERTESDSSQIVGVSSNDVAEADACHDRGVERALTADEDEVEESRRGSGAVLTGVPESDVTESHQDLRSDPVDVDTGDDSAESGCESEAVMALDEAQQAVNWSISSDVVDADDRTSFPECEHCADEVTTERSGQMTDVFGTANTQSESEAAMTLDEAGRTGSGVGTTERASSFPESETCEVITALDEDSCEVTVGESGSEAAQNPRGERETEQCHEGGVDALAGVYVDDHDSGTVGDEMAVTAEDVSDECDKTGVVDGVIVGRHGSSRCCEEEAANEDSCEVLDPGDSVTAALNSVPHVTIAAGIDGSGSDYTLELPAPECDQSGRSPVERTSEDIEEARDETEMSGDVHLSIRDDCGDDSGKKPGELNDGSTCEVVSTENVPLAYKDDDTQVVNDCDNRAVQSGPSDSDSATLGADVVSKCDGDVIVEDRSISSPHFMSDNGELTTYTHPGGSLVGIDCNIPCDPITGALDEKDFPVVNRESTSLVNHVHITQDDVPGSTTSSRSAAIDEDSTSVNGITGCDIHPIEYDIDTEDRGSVSDISRLAGVTAEAILNTTNHSMPCSDTAVCHHEATDVYIDYTIPVYSDSPVSNTESSDDCSATKSSDDNSSLSSSDLDHESQNAATPVENSVKSLIKNSVDCSLDFPTENSRDINKQWEYSDIDCQDVTKLKLNVSQLKSWLKDQDQRNKNLLQANERLVVQVKETKAAMKSVHSSNSDDACMAHIKTLETTVSSQKKDIQGLREKLTSHDTAAKRAVLSLQNDLKLRVDQVTKMYEDCVREKDSMVVKYAQAEQKNNDLRQRFERADVGVRELLKERDHSAGVMKSLQADRQRAIADGDKKASELDGAMKEIEKIKEVLCSADVRIKWAQNKHKAELDAHRDTHGKLEKMTAKYKETKEEGEQIRRDCQRMVQAYQHSEEMKSNTLESELKQQKQEKTDTDEIYHQKLRELESLKIKHATMEDQLKHAREKGQSLDKKRFSLEEDKARSYDTIVKQKKELKALQAKVESLVFLQTEYDRAQSMIKSLDQDVNELKLCGKDQQIEIDSCRQRESELLHLTETLSERNALLQSENTSLNTQVLTMKSNEQRVSMEIQELDTTRNDKLQNLVRERDTIQAEIDTLKNDQIEKSRQVSDMERRLADEQDQIKTIKRKHSNNIKDLTRQLQQTRRRLETLESGQSGDVMGSRTSSIGSLNTQGENQPGSSAQMSQSQPHPEEAAVITEQVEIDTKVLIERIVKLQRMLARQNEKTEFMEDHIHQLTEDIRKKAKVIQNYVLREEAGALSPETMDANKAQLSKKGGIMASVYKSHTNDSHMSLDLSLEINHKQQAVLEDALLKNITLKESFDTLGQEIARLSQENRRLQLLLQQYESDTTSR